MFSFSKRRIVVEQQNYEVSKNRQCIIALHAEISRKYQEVAKLLHLEALLYKMDASKDERKLH